MNAALEASAQILQSSHAATAGAVNDVDLDGSACGGGGSWTRGEGEGIGDAGLRDGLDRGEVDGAADGLGEHHTRKHGTEGGGRDVREELGSLQQDVAEMALPHTHTHTHNQLSVAMPPPNERRPAHSGMCATAEVRGLRAGGLPPKAPFRGRGAGGVQQRSRSASRRDEVLTREGVCLSLRRGGGGGGACTSEMHQVSTRFCEEMRRVSMLTATPNCMCVCVCVCVCVCAHTCIAPSGIWLRQWRGTGGKPRMWRRRATARLLVPAVVA